MQRLITVFILLLTFPIMATAQYPLPIPTGPPGVINQPALGTMLSIEQVQGLTNDNCISAQIVASCASQFCPDCVVLQYWQPMFAVAIVKRPGDRLVTGVSEVGLAVGGSNRLLGGGGGDNATTSGNTNLHYSEAQVYTLPQPFTIGCQLCGRPDVIPVANYLSESDDHWVTAELTQTLYKDFLAEFSAGPLGVWGPITPTNGYHVHSSATVAAAATAAKALWVASVPSIPLRNVNIPAEPSGCFQPAWPVKMPCMPVGMYPPLWDFVHVTPEGKYLYIFWVRRFCCMPVDQTVCALAASGQGENFCPLPLLGPAAGLAAFIAGTSVFGSAEEGDGTEGEGDQGDENNPDDTGETEPVSEPQTLTIPNPSR